MKAANLANFKLNLANIPPHKRTIFHVNIVSLRATTICTYFYFLFYLEVSHFFNVFFLTGVEKYVMYFFRPYQVELDSKNKTSLSKASISLFQGLTHRSAINKKISSATMKKKKDFN